MKRLSPPWVRWFGVVLIAVSAGLVIARGSSSLPLKSPTTPQSSTLMISDTPLNGVLAFEVTIKKVALTGSRGSVTILDTPRRVELSRLAGVLEPLALTNLPADNYTQATVTFGRAEVLFVPSRSSNPVHADISKETTATMVLNPPIVVPEGASTLGLDLKLDSSLSIDSANNVTFNPVFTMAAGSAGRTEQPDGELTELKGVLSAMTGQQFTIMVGTTPQTLSFSSDATTRLDSEGMPFANLPLGTVLEVDAKNLSDGSLLAKRVAVVSQAPSGGEVEGLLTQVSTGSEPALKLAADEVSAPILVAPRLATVVTANVGAQTRFVVAGMLPDLNEFSFQSLSDLAPGQNIQADTDSDNGVLFTAKSVQLKPQALEGTVSGMNHRGFTLILDGDSTFARLTGRAAVNVVTDSPSIGILGSGQRVRVRGLLFAKSVSGTNTSNYSLLASRIQNP